MDYINLEDYQKVSLTKKGYAVAVGGVEFDVYRHKVSKKEVRVRRGGNEIIPYSKDEDFFPQNVRKGKIIPLNDVSQLPGAKKS